MLVILTIVSISLSVYLYIKMFVDRATIYLPTYLPPGFARTNGIKISQIDGNTVYITEYDNAFNGDFVMAQEIGGHAVCMPPAKGDNVFVDFQMFSPTGSSVGCMVTMKNNANGTHKRSYDWQLNSDKLLLLVDNNVTISDDEMLRVANSLHLQTVHY